MKVFLQYLNVSEEPDLSGGRSPSVSPSVIGWEAHVVNTRRRVQETVYLSWRGHFLFGAAGEMTDEPSLIFWMLKRS